MATAAFLNASDIEALKYPSSDGKPMAETDIHAKEIVALFQMIDERYADNPNVYVAMNNLLYFKTVEDRIGNEKIRVSPDVYVVFGVPKGERRVYYLWQEKKPPNVVFEVSSRDTKREDLGAKKDIYEAMGVKEYIFYDPDRNPLKSPLRGFRLTAGVFQPIPLEPDGTLLSRELNLKFKLDEWNRIHAFDADSGEELLRLPAAKKASDARARKEAARAQLEAARAKMEAKARAKFEERAIAEAEARLKSEERAKAETEARLKADEHAKAESEARLKADEHAKAESEARLKADERAKAEIEARLKSDERAKAETEARLKAEAENARLREELARLKKG